MRRVKIDPMTVARIKHELRCPDCDSRVTIKRAEGGLLDTRIEHDGTCPWLAEQSAGRPFQRVAMGAPIDRLMASWGLGLAAEDAVETTESEPGTRGRVDEV